MPTNYANHFSCEMDVGPVVPVRSRSICKPMHEQRRRDNDKTVVFIDDVDVNVYLADRPIIETEKVKPEIATPVGPVGPEINLDDLTDIVDDSIRGGDVKIVAGDLVRDAEALDAEVEKIRDDVERVTAVLSATEARRRNVAAVSDLIKQKSNEVYASMGKPPRFASGLGDTLKAPFQYLSSRVWLYVAVVALALLLFFVVKK